MTSKVYNEDCLPALRRMPDKSVTLCCADPPYGLNIMGRAAPDTHTHTHTARRVGSSKPFGSKAIRGEQTHVIEAKFYPVFDDGSPPDAEVFRELLRVSEKLIIWGGNFFLDNLGAASCMIVWDKKRRGMTQADCEIAWTNLKGQSRVFEYRWNGMLQENMKKKEVRIHATQKPVDLYLYCYELAGLKAGDTVLDPYMGSQSSRIAAHDMGLNYIGYEINETYFKLGCERYDAHTAQYSLFE